MIREDSNVITHGDRRAHELDPKDPGHIAALKRQWNTLADRETAQAAEYDRLELSRRQMSGRALASLQRMEETRRERLAIEEALDLLRGGPRPRTGETDG